MMIFIQAMILLSGISLLGISVIIVNTFIKHSSLPSYLLGFLITSYTFVVMISEITSLLRSINVLAILLFLLVLAVINILIWYCQGRLPLLCSFTGSLSSTWQKIPTFKSHLALYILAIGVVLVYLFGAGLILDVPQNNYDSMTYHLSRVGYWMQHQTLSPWPTPNPRQTTSPINAELGILWTILFWGTDQLAGFVQWFSAIGILVGIYGIARLMGATRPQSAFASLIWATFPQIVLQATTTQNDLVAAFFFTSMLYFLFHGYRDRNISALFLSGIAFGLAAGTKATVIIALPGLAIAVVLLWLLTGKSGFKPLFLWSIFCILGFGLLGAFVFVQNQVYYGNPFSNPEWATVVTQPIESISQLPRFLSNLIIYASQFFDFSGIPSRIASPFIELRARILEWTLFDSGLTFQVSKMYSSSHYLNPSRIIHEDTTWFGPLAFLVLIPATLTQCIRGIKTRDPIRLTLIIASIGFYFTLSVLMAWSPYRSRYFILMISCLAPLMALIYQPGGKEKWYFGFVAVLAIGIMISTTLTNVSKPLIGSKSVWAMEPEDLRMSNNQKMIPVRKMVDMHVPSDAVLGTRLGVDHWDYIFFGKNFDRTIIQLDPKYPGIDMDFVRNKGIDFVLTAPRERPFLEVPTGLEYIDDVSGWYLFATSLDQPPGVPDNVYQSLLGLHDEKSLLDVDENLSGVVGLTEMYTPVWEVETNGEDSFKWLGEGLNQGLQIFLWSEDQVPVGVRFYLQPGPSRNDIERNLQVAYYPYGAYRPLPEGSSNQTIQIEDSTTYELVVQLQEGLNEFRIFCLDRATIPVLPNGDQRPLLVRLDHVTVEPLANRVLLLKLDEVFKDDLQPTEQYLATWGLETYEDKPFLWLGEGPNQGYRSVIWSEKDVAIRMVFHLMPGPAREDSYRSLELSHSSDDESEPGSVFYEINIDGPIEYEVDINLQQGLNEINLYVLDGATVPVQPNGDSRPILVRLDQIDIVPGDDR